MPVCQTFKNIPMSKKRIVAGRLIDGSGSPVQKNVCLLIEEGRIADMYPMDQAASGNDGEIIDLRHCTLIPPLVDCSLSLSLSAATEAQAEGRAEIADYNQAEPFMIRHLRYCFSHGVLAVADGSDRHGFVRQFKKALAPGKGMVIRTGTWLPWDWPERNECPASFDDDFVRIACSPDMEKSLNSRSCLPAAEIKTLLAPVAKKKRVAVANGERAVAEALEGGCGAIEQGVFMGAGNIVEMAERGVVWIPNLFKLKVLADTAPSRMASLYQKALLDQLGLLRQARQAGVKVAAGTAAGFAGILHGESMREEIKLLLAAGYPLVEALRCASTNGSEFLEIDDIGVLQKGGPATFLVTRGTVQQLPRKLGYLEDIYIAGSSSDMYRKNPVKTVYPQK